MAQYTSERPIAYKPGNVFNYSSGETNLLMGILKKAINNKERYNDFPWKELFEPLGMKNITWEQDQSGTFVGSSYLYMPSRELIKFGELFLNQGNWKGKRVLSSSWVRFSYELAPAVNKTETERS